MFGVIHPLLLWGTTAVSVPILIHLLLRQRPRPRPWAAMQWLLAAIQKAQRKYRLTNLLLLLMRCLIVLLIALAVARPNLAGLGSGGKLVIIVDASASMGPRGEDPGPLAFAKAEISKASLPQHVVVLAMSDNVKSIADGGAAEAQSAIEQMSASALPGGLDRAASVAADQVLAAVGADADVVLVSDFQQDDGEMLAAMLKDRSRSLKRWQVGKPSANAVITGFGRLPDVQPGQASELQVQVEGPASGVKIAVDGGPSMPSTMSSGVGSLRLVLPQMEPGEHRVLIELQDQGLRYDNILEIPIQVRAPVPVLVVSDGVDYLTASLLADTTQLAAKPLRPAQLSTEQPPQGGAIALRGRTGDGDRLSKWVAKDGGVLWASLADLRNDPQLKELVAGIGAKEGAEDPGGALNCGDHEIDDVLGVGVIEKLPVFTLPEKTEILLRAGKAPLVVALPSGQGSVVVELAELQGLDSIEARGTTPLWVRQTVRALTARLNQSRVWQAGAPAPETIKLQRDGNTLECVQGEAVMASPGTWQAEHGGEVITVANVDEGKIDKGRVNGAAESVDDALPRRQGADWGWPLLVAALLMMFGEGLIASWAGRTYGR